MGSLIVVYNLKGHFGDYLVYFTFWPDFHSKYVLLNFFWLNNDLNYTIKLLQEKKH